MNLPGSLIAPFVTGLDTDTEPWQSPADSFLVADNVHVYNGFVEKRSGYRLFGKLKKLDAAVAISGISQALNAEVTTAVNHGYVNDDVVFINGVLGMTQVNGRYFSITVTALNTFQLNIDSTLYGLYTGAGSAYKTIDSLERVMGIYQFQKNDGTRETLAFSQQRAYKYDIVTENFLALDIVDIMNGSDTDYIWAINLQSSSLTNRLYFTNGKAFSGALNGIRYYDGSGTGYTTTLFTPSLGGGRTLYGAKLLFSLKERLLVMNTFENSAGVTTNNMQRMRWCQAQGPSNWNDLTPGGGGFVDAPTGDQIITARSLQDEIIVCFSQSGWAAQPVSDPALPFRWTKLNDFRAADGKMASIGYDQYVMTLGLRGIVACDGADTQRVDQRISDFVSNEINSNEFQKVFCARSFAERRTWILYPEIESDENSAALIFDEDSKAYTTYTISMNCLGYGSFATDLSLSDFTAANDLDIALLDCTDETLKSYAWQGSGETLLGGDITGNIFVMETEGSDDGEDIALTLTTAGWNPFLSQDSQAYFSYLDIYTDTDQKTIAQVDFFKDDETDPYKSTMIDFLPNLDYIAAIVDITQAVSAIVNAPNHGLSDGDIVFIYGVIGMTEVNAGPYTVSVVDINNIRIGIDSTLFGAYTNGGSLYRRQFYKTKVWKRAYAGGVGYLHNVRISSSGINCPLKISGFKPVFKPRGKRLVN